MRRFKYQLFAVLGFSTLAFFYQNFSAVSAPDDVLNECSVLVNSSRPSSKFVLVGEDGKLIYKRSTKNSSHSILDFSYAGYGGGGVAIPKGRISRNLYPSGRDDSDAIQSAIDEVSKLPLQSNGLRGVVYLREGEFTVSKELKIAASGVVLSGVDETKTVVRVVGSPRTVLNIAGKGGYNVSGSQAHQVLFQDKLMAGTRTLTLNSVQGLSEGDSVAIYRPVTVSWLKFMGMYGMTRVVNGQTLDQIWIEPNTDLISDRVIESVDVRRNRVTLDAPLSDTVDASLLEGKSVVLKRYTFDGRLNNVGVEHIHFEGPRSVRKTSETAFKLISISRVVDGWVRYTSAKNLMTGYEAGPFTKRISFVLNSISQDVAQINDMGTPAYFNVAGQQILISRGSTAGGGNAYFGVATGANAQLVTVVSFSATGPNALLQPHMRWATGVLFDNVSADGIEFLNRGVMGTGHGWAAGQSVIWNSRANDDIVVALPPGSANWSVGSASPLLKTKYGASNGEVDSHGHPVDIVSLYKYQLCQRMGLQSIGAAGFPIPTSN